MQKINVLVIDGQGGQMGSQIIKEILARYDKCNVTAVGTNATAAAAMIKAGAKQVATGENPVIVACRKADVIVGPIGIVIADSLFGEITPAMAVAVGQAVASKILIPVNKCENLVAGVQDISVGALITDAVIKFGKIVEKLI